MKFWSGVNELLRSVSSSSPDEKETIQGAIAEAAQRHLGHQSRIDNLTDLVQADDFEQLAFDDREKVRQYEDHKLGWRKSTAEPASRIGRAGKGKNEMGHILGDVKIEQPPNRNPISGVVVPLATTGLLGLIAWKLFDQPSPVQLDPQSTTTEQVVEAPAPAIDTTDRDTRYGLRIYREPGNEGSNE